MPSPLRRRHGTPATTSRLVAVDAARGAALLAMMAVHALYVVDADGEPALPHTLFAGRAGAAFAVLAGVGIAFMTGRMPVSTRRDGRAAVASLTIRALAIGAVGLALGYTQARFGAVILPYYAVLFVLAIPLVFLRTRILVAVGCAIAVIVPVLSHLARGALPAPRLDNPGLGYLLGDPGGLLAELALTGYYPAVPWTAYVCAGLVVGRLTLASARVAGMLVVGGLAAAVTASGASWLLTGPLGGEQRLLASAAASGTGAGRVADILTFGPPGTTPTSTWWWLAIDAPHSSTPFDLLHTAGSAVALLGGLLLATHAAGPVVSAARRRALAPLAAAGAMPLTLYTAHIVFMNSPLDVFGAVTGYLVQVAVALAFAVTWSAAVGRGPLEGIVAELARRARRLAAGPSGPLRSDGLPARPRGPRRSGCTARTRNRGWPGVALLPAARRPLPPLSSRSPSCSSTRTARSVSTASAPT